MLNIFRNMCFKRGKDEDKRRWNKMGDTVYALGLVGALFYFIQHATSFGDGLFGVVKAIVWPALLVFRLFGFLKM